MLIVEHMSTWGFEHAIRGMRNPMNSWDKSDSHFHYHSCLDCDHQPQNCENDHKIFADCVCFNIGENDLDLMQRLYKAGTEHGKYLRQIFVSMDITAPLYWWKEFDTYKVGTVANSCSTMHKIHAKKFELDDFSHEHLHEICRMQLEEVIQTLNIMRERYIKTNAKEFWWQIIQLLPSSYNQKRTITMNYENVMNIINQRQYHKLDEWVNFVKYLRILPYIKEIRDEEK